MNMAVPGVGDTLLHEAAGGNHIRKVRTLVDLGANCDIQDENGKTALHVSAETGSLEVAKFIVEHQKIKYGEAECKYTVTLDRAISKLKRLNFSEKRWKYAIAPCCSSRKHQHLALLVNCRQ